MTEAVHRRHDPLLDEWVLVSPHRNRRPWQGQVEAPEPSARPFVEDCYLCPGNPRAGGHRNPDYADVLVFDNDFPALLDASDMPSADPEALLRSAPVRGRCRVLCYSPRHDLSLAELDDAGRLAVVRAWVEETRSLGEDWAWVQVFENRGAAMGCSSPHPHGQIWALDVRPTLVQREDAQQRAHHQRTGRRLLADVVAEERAAGERVVVEGRHWLAWVPYWARWPYECMLAPLRPVAGLWALDAEEQADLAAVLGELMRACDNLFSCAFPYSFGWHGLPRADADAAHWHLHGHLYPPLLRSASVRKFMVGFEMLAEAQRDLTPEDAAQRLRDARGPHWRTREPDE